MSPSLSLHQNDNNEPSLRSRAIAVLLALILILTVASAGCLVEDVAADEITVIQMPGSGTLHWYTTQGWKPQWFGAVTTYKKRDIYRFENAPIRFNDNGTATMNGSIQVDMPTDFENLNQLHTKYGSQEAINQQIVKTVVDKVLFMTGPLMSSRESVSEKRTDLIRYVQDQIDGGVYQVETRVVEQTDTLTGQRTTMNVSTVRVINGVAQRQEQTIVGEFGLRAFNFAITSIDYDDQVEQQMQAQQQIVMSVQTSIANARKAEQERITVEQQGMASAAQAKWEQEKDKARAIVEGEKQRDLAKLDAEAAAAYKTATLLRAEADATYKRQVMQADGALTQKLEAWKAAQGSWASAFQNFKGAVVPSVVMGGAGAGAPASGAQTFMDIMMAKAAKDLALDLQPSVK